jgi:hypothetical protein
MQLRTFVTGVYPVLVLQICLTLICMGTLLVLPTERPIGQLVITSSLGVIELALLWLARFRTPFGRVAVAYGLPGFHQRSRT